MWVFCGEIRAKWVESIRSENEAQTGLESTMSFLHSTRQCNIVYELQRTPQ